MNNINVLISLLRLDKPVGFLLLFFPCAFSTLLFNSHIDQLVYFLNFFLIGSIIMRSAGCIINDILDRHIDIQVKRTASRPIAAKVITISQTLPILGILLLIGLLLLMMLNKQAIKLGYLAFPLICIYPLAKRFSNFAQVFLACTFNLGALIAATHFNNKALGTSILVYLGCIFWTIGYDTVYGFMDIIDDKKIGLKSLAIKLEKSNFKIYLVFFYSIFILCLFAACMIVTHSKYSCLFIALWCFLTYQTLKLDIKDTKNCLSHFNQSALIGLIACLIIFCSQFSNYN